MKCAMEGTDDMRILVDKDILFSADMEHPKCMTVAQFLASEGVEE